jgi:hypothetical protein
MTDHQSKKSILPIMALAFTFTATCCLPPLRADDDSSATPRASKEKVPPEPTAVWRTDVIAFDKYLGEIVAGSRVPETQVLRRITLEGEGVALDTEVVPLGSAAGKEGLVDLKPAKDTVQFRVNEALKGQRVKWEVKIEGGVVVPGSHMTIASKYPLLQSLILEAPWREPEDVIVTGDRVKLEGTIGDFATNKGSRVPLAGPVAVYHRADAPATVFRIGLKEATITRVVRDKSPDRHAPDAEREDAIAWQDFLSARLKELRGKNKPVLVFCRADWDLTCEVLDRTLFTDRRVIDAITQRKYIPLRADCSKAPDEMLKGFLRDVGWVGTATVVIFRGPNSEDPVVLRVDSTRKLISPENLLDAMKSK